LTSVLQQQQHKIPTIRSFPDLQKSRLSIGCQQGSFTTGYLTDNLFIAPDRLVALVTQDDYDKALKSGRVAAIIDESPYIETFLTKSGCKYKTADSNIAYFGGLAFVRACFDSLDPFFRPSEFARC
jgi:ionotropic glutamate receptor